MAWKDDEGVLTSFNVTMVNTDGASQLLIEITLILFQRWERKIRNVRRNRHRP